MSISEFGVRLELAGAELRYQADWMPADQADAAMRLLTEEVPWTQHQVHMFGRAMLAPRLSAWIGDPGTFYRYSKVLHAPQPWTPTLMQIRVALRATVGADFNSVLVNRYRDGRDSMGWHADDEPELGPDPLIASVSLGALRSMRLRARRTGGARLDIELGKGSLLLMSGATQRNYLHAIDKQRKLVGERINLTFRQILLPRPLQA